MAHKNKISVSPGQYNAFITKEFKNWKKALYSEKDKPDRFEKHQQTQSHMTVVLRQFTLPSKEYDKDFEMHNKNIATEKSDNRQVLLAVVENIRFLGKMFHYFFYI